MNYSYLMDILDARDELMKHFCCLCLREPFVLDNIVEEFSPFHELHDKKELLGSLFEFIKLHDVGVTNEF